MKFSWKIFLSTILTIIITFSIGGYLLISSLFHYALDREINTALDENKILRFSFETTISAMQSNFKKLSDVTVYDIAKSIDKSLNNAKSKIRISNSKNKVLYSSDHLDFSQNFFKDVNDKMRTYTIMKKGNSYWVYSVCISRSDSQKIYLESFKNITSVFEERNEQYNIYKKVISILILLNGIILYFISLWLMKPIRRLSKVTQKITGGNLGQRAETNNNDEIGKLAQDFNIMADNLEKKIYDLEDAARRQEDFIASFSHELKTPLTSIIGYADRLRSAKMEEEEKFMAANYVFNEGKRLENLSIKLLNLIVAKKHSMELQKINAVNLFEDIRRSMVTSINPDIALHVSAERAELTVDIDLIKTVFINLIDNAGKAIDGKGAIYLTGKKEEGGYGIYVADTGKGVPKEELQKITEAFYVVDKSRSREKGGVGLGLSIVSEIIKLHHGELRFDSIMGEGTCVYVFLKEGESGWGAV